MREQTDTDRLGGHQYLTFILGEEEYAVDILRVREIRVWEAVTPIPRTASFIKGVINLRGAIVPVIDLGERFGLPAHPYGPRTVMIVLGVMDGERERLMALVVDAVADVQTLNADQTSAPPDFGAAIDNAYIRGLATIEGRMLVLLDSDRLLDLQEIYAVAGPAVTSADNDQDKTPHPPANR